MPKGYFYINVGQVIGVIGIIAITWKYLDFMNNALESENPERERERSVAEIRRKFGL